MKRCWAIAPFDFRVREQWEDVWKYDLANNVISVGWGDTGDLTGLPLEAVLKRFRGIYGADSKVGGHVLFKLYNMVKVGDKIIARRGTKQIAAVGTVIQRAFFDRKKHAAPYEDDTYWHHLGVRWDLAPRDLSFRRIIFGIKALQEVAEDAFVALTQSAPVNVEEADWSDREIDALIVKGRLRIGAVPTDNPEGLVRLRRGQDRLRKLTLENYGNRCAVCDVTDPALLIASHIVGWAAGPLHRGKLGNVICLCRIHDALFEAGYWSLTDDLRILKKTSPGSATIDELLRSMTAFRIPTDFRPMPQFLKRHRKRCRFTT